MATRDPPLTAKSGASGVAPAAQTTRSGASREHRVPCRLGSGPELDAEAAQLPLEVVDEVEQLAAGRAGSRDPQLPPDRVGALVDDDVVPGLRGNACRLEPTRATAGDDDAALGRGSGHGAPLLLAPGARMDRASDDPLRPAAVLDDADAGADLLRPSLLRLPDPVRVGELCAADPDEVRLPRCERLLREVRDGGSDRRR